MYRKLFTILMVITFALGPVRADAQQDTAPAKDKQTEDQALRQKAFELLESLAGELGSLQSPENRARIGSNIAWSLWPHNETRARALFTSVQEDIKLGLQLPEIDSPEDMKTFMVFLKLRADVTERIAKHDPESAYEFFKSTALNPETELPDHIWQSERNLEAHLAKQLISTNPDLSLDLGRKMLARGFSDNLRLLLLRLNRKHKAQASTLYKEIVRKLADVDLAEDWPARHFALNLAHSFAPPVGDEATFREIANLFLKALAQHGCYKNLDDEDEEAGNCRELAPAIALIAKVEPSRASKLQRWAEQSTGYYSPPNAYYELNETANQGSVDDILALIEQFPQMEIDIRFRAIQKATQDGDMERARKIATEYVGEPHQQHALLAQLERIPRKPSFNNEDLEVVQKQLGEIRGGPGRQVVYLSSIASQIGDNDRKTALKLLNQAAELTETMKPGKEQTGTQILLAVMYCYEKSPRGLAMMESLIPKLNELVTSASKLDGYDTSYMRAGEWNMTAEGDLGSILTQLAQRAGYFAWCDFDRAVSMAGQFERPEIRMMAQLKLAQGILAGPPKRLPLEGGGTQY